MHGDDAISKFSHAGDKVRCITEPRTNIASSKCQHIRHVKPAKIGLNDNVSN